jgi:signal transduction histidine kinase
LDAVEELEELNKSLQEEKHIGELRETFIAILGHDLRNPVGTIRMCADILLQMELSDIGKRQATTIKSTSYRMQGLIDNLLDFAKGHLGEGLKLELSNNTAALKKLLKQVSKEIKTVDKEHEIKLIMDLKEPVECDINRICQLYSNLLGNAMKHGSNEQPITSKIKVQDGTFSIKVTNSGDKIPEEKISNLFKPFFTTNASKNKSGLGLGLYISSEIAKAHGGQLQVDSTDERTVFEFTMPTLTKANLNE